MEEIDIKRIHLSRHRLRSVQGDLEGLITSIEQKGLLQPIVVRPADNSFEVVAGNRRLDACKRLRWTKIQCHVAELDDKEAYEVSLIENLQRKTLDPIEQAEAFRKYVDEYGYGAVSDLARKIGKSPSYVSRRIALLELPEDVKEQLLRRRKAPAVAQELLSLDEEHRRKLTQLVMGKEITRNEVRRTIARIRAKDRDEHIGNLYEAQERRQRTIERALAKYVASLKICMMRFDDVMRSVSEDEWILREVLAQHRKFAHQQIDSLLTLKKRMARSPPP